MDEPVFRELVWEFLASFKFSSVACMYHPDFEGITFRLGGEPRKMSLLEFGWRVRLYYEKQFRLSSMMSGLGRGETIKAEHLFMQFWPNIRDDKFIVERVKEKDLLVGGMFVTRIANSFGLLTNLMVDALSVEPRAHVGEEDEVEEAANEEAGGSAEYLSTCENLDPHLQIDPFPRREADYPPYGYTNHMPLGYEYQFGPTPPGGSD
ncbi:hypothetical protein Tco_0053080 [Tanacetum coccineum]